MVVEEVVRSALYLIGQQASEHPIQPPQMTMAIGFLNRIMSGVAYLEFDYVAVDSSSDDVLIPAYAEEWVILKLAKRLAPIWPETTQLGSINDDLKDAWNNLLKQHCNQKLPTCRFQSTMPVGSGNEEFTDLTFYPVCDEDEEECEEDDV